MSCYVCAALLCAAIPLVYLLADKINKCIKTLKEWNNEQLTSAYKDEWNETQSEESVALLHRIHFGSGQFSWGKIFLQSVLLPRKLAEQAPGLLTPCVSSSVYTFSLIVLHLVRNASICKTYFWIPLSRFLLNCLLRYFDGVENLVRDMVQNKSYYVYAHSPDAEKCDVYKFYLALLSALRGKSFDRCLLIPEGDVGENILHLACKHQNVKVLNAILDFAADRLIKQLLGQLNEQGNTPLHEACSSFESTESDNTILHTIFSKLTPGVAKLCLSAQNEEGKSILHWAASKGVPSNLLERILEHSPPDAKHSGLQAADERGYTVLHLIVANTDLVAVQEKLEVIQSSMDRRSYFELLHALDGHGDSALHLFLRNYKMWDAEKKARNLILNKLSLMQRKSVFNIPNRNGNTVHQVASQMAENDPQAVEMSGDYKQALLDIVMSDKSEETECIEAEYELQEIIEGLTKEDLERTVESKNVTRYLIPNTNSKRENSCKPHAMILYTTEDRKGADEEADILIDALKRTGIEPSITPWSDLDELVHILDNSSTPANCSLLIVCIMAHGQQGVLLDAKNARYIDDLLQRITLLPHIPMITIIQACQTESTCNNTKYNSNHASSLSTLNEYDAKSGKVVQHDARGGFASTNFIKLTRKHSAILHSTVAGGMALRGAFTEAVANQIAKSDGKTHIIQMFQNAMREMEQSDIEQIPRYEQTMDRDCCIPPASKPRTATD